MNELPEYRPPMILVAEDDEDDRMLAAEAIVRAGLQSEVRFFEDGVELMDHLTEAAVFDEDGSLDREIILLDINMPRKDGWSVLEELKADERFKSIPVILLTTSSSQPDVERCYRMGANSFITKPQSFSGLVELVSEVSRYWFETVRLPGHVPS
jgi:CheY-like chemotaxis protein